MDDPTPNQAWTIEFLDDTDKHERARLDKILKDELAKTVQRLKDSIKECNKHPIPQDLLDRIPTSPDPEILSKYLDIFEDDIDDIPWFALANSNANSNSPQPNSATPSSQPSTPIGPLDQSSATIQRSYSAGMPPPPSPKRSTAAARNNTTASVPSRSATPMNSEDPALSRSVSRTSSFVPANLVGSINDDNSHSESYPATTMLNHDKPGSCLGDSTTPRSSEYTALSRSGSRTSSFAPANLVGSINDDNSHSESYPTTKRLDHDKAGSCLGDGATPRSSEYPALSRSGSRTSSFAPANLVGTINGDKLHSESYPATTMLNHDKAGSCLGDRATPMKSQYPALSRSVSRTSSFATANLVGKNNDDNLHSESYPATTVLNHDKAEGDSATPMDSEYPALSRSGSRTSSLAPANLVGTNNDDNLHSESDPATTMLNHDKAGSCSGDCSSQSCDGGCSIDQCPPGCIPECDLSCDMPSCDGSQLCDVLDACTSLECTDSPVCLDDSCRWTSYGHVPAFGNDFSNQSADTEANDPMHCLWVIPGQQCEVSVPTMESLGQHVLREHIEPQGTFTCPIDQCFEKLDAQQASRHLLHQHNQDSYVCLWKNCGQAFPDSTELDRHMKIAHTNLDCHWAGCEVSTKELSQLKKHVDVDHLHFPGDSQPPMSPYTFQPTISAGHHPTLHISTHSPFTSSHPSPLNQNQKPFLQGSIIPPYQNALPSPMSSEQRAFQNDAIPSHPTLSKHPFAVDDDVSRCLWVTDRSIGQVCGKTFVDGNELQLHVDQEHVWTSEGNTGAVLLCHWLECKRNGKPLQNKEKLRRHLFTHTGFWIVRCHVCEKTFNNKVALENHLRVHTGEKPFACKDCEQCFATEAALTIHKRHHTGEKPLVCPVCEYASADSSNMAKHKKTHEPHEHFCPICNKGFSRSGTLERHKKVHDPNRPLRRKRAHSQISS